MKKYRTIDDAEGDYRKQRATERIPGTIEVSVADYRRQRKAYEAMLEALLCMTITLRYELLDTEGKAAWNKANAAIKLAEGDT
jgi:hypothetical protein